MKTRVPCPNLSVLRGLLLGELSCEEAESVGEHLTNCPGCLQTVGELNVEDNLVRAARQQPESLPKEVEQRLQGIIDHLQGLPHLGIDPAAFTAELSSPLVRTQCGLASPAGESSSEPTQEVFDFLEPGQQPGEIGRLGSYRLLRILGAGGMGVVFQAADEHLDRVVALKVIRPALADNEQFHRRFQREARALAALKHDHVVTVYQVGEVAVRGRKIPFAAMEFLEGQSLDERLRKESRLAVAEVVRIGREIALGLAAAHKRGLIHRDIKPGNIWLEADSGRVKLLDFGLARGGEGEQNLTQTGVVMGTPAFMAPEQARSEKVDPRADLFSLGCVLYQLSTGQMPFRGESTLAVLTSLALSKPTPPRQLNPALPVRLAALIERLLSKDPSGRPATAQAVVEELAAIESEPAARRKPAGKRWSAALWLIAAGLLGVLAVVVATRKPVWRESLPPNPAEQVASSVVQEPLRVVRLDIKHFANLNNREDLPTGLLGRDVFSAQQNDSVELEAELSRPGYAYLIAFRPDGTEELCFPESEDEVPPLTARPRYPWRSRGVNYGLNEGTGLQVFVVVASDKPLPPYRQWTRERGQTPWGKCESPMGVVWLDDGGPVEVLTAGNRERSERGKGRRVAGKAEVVGLTDWLRKAPGVEAVTGVGFAVLNRK